MPTKPAFAETFATLRSLIKRHGSRLTVTADTPSEFMVASRNQVDRAGRALFVAGVQMKKNYSAIT